MGTELVLQGPPVPRVKSLKLGVQSLAHPGKRRKRIRRVSKRRLAVPETLGVTH